MENNNYKKWCELFVFLEVVAEVEPIHLKAFLSLSKRFNIEPQLYHLIQFYSFNNRKNDEEK